MIMNGVSCRTKEQLDDAFEVETKIKKKMNGLCIVERLTTHMGEYIVSRGPTEMKILTFLSVHKSEVCEVGQHSLQ